MTVSDDHFGDMAELDDRLVEELFGVGTASEHLPSAVARVGTLVRCAQAPPTREELSSEHTIVGAMERVIAQEAGVRTARGAATLVGRSLAAKVVIAVTLGTVGITAAAATGGVIGLMGDPPSVDIERPPVSSTTVKSTTSTPAPTEVPPAGTAPSPAECDDVAMPAVMGRESAAADPCVDPGATSVPPAEVGEGSAARGGSSPGQGQSPSGSDQTPPGQDQTPPGQSSTPLGQSETPPGQSQTPPGQSQTPPGRDQTPPGQDQTPPGQDQTPPGQSQTPPGQEHTPPGQN
jgi:hypothetical protein